MLAIYFAGLSFYAFDHVNIVSYLVDLTVGRGAPDAGLLTHAIFGAGALLVFLAAGARMWAAAYLRANTVQDPAMHLDAIVADGPYRHVRNPLYLGAILLAFGISLLVSRTGFLFITITLTIFFLRLTGLEELNLEREQGETYIEFCKRVPRLWPSLAPRLPNGRTKARWGQAILGEIHMWGFFAGMAAFAITLNKRVAWWIVGTALVLYLVRSYVLSIRRNKAHRQQSGIPG
jgi:protein-S-isoprenylcysteine O-methyltransferase Ste14